METKRTLFRDTDNKMLGGVASGLAEYMGWDVTVTRLVFVFCLFASLSEMAVTGLLQQILS